MYSKTSKSKTLRVVQSGVVAQRPDNNPINPYYPNGRDYLALMAHTPMINNRKAPLVPAHVRKYLSSEGLPSSEIKDEHHSHLHPTLAAYRSWFEKALFMFVLTVDSIFEISCSNRTIGWNYNRMWLNRPVIDGFNGDCSKRLALAQLRQGVANCNCLSGDTLCEHSADATVIFSTDTMYYTMRAIISDLVAFPTHKHFHVFHVPKFASGCCFPDEQNKQCEATYRVADDRIVMAVRGNAQPYEHQIYFTKDCMQFYDSVSSKYILATPMEVADTGATGTTYGLFKITVHNTEQTYWSRDNTDFNITTSHKYTYEALSNSKELAIVDAKLLDITGDKKEGIYSYMADGHKNYLIVDHQVEFVTQKCKHIVMDLTKLTTIIRAIATAVAKSVNGKISRETLKYNVMLTLNSLGLGPETNLDAYETLVSYSIYRSGLVLDIVGRTINENTLDTWQNKYKGVVKKNSIWPYLLLTVVFLGMFTSGYYYTHVHIPEVIPTTYLDIFYSGLNSFVVFCLSPISVAKYFAAFGGELLAYLYSGDLSYFTIDLSPYLAPFGEWLEVFGMFRSHLYSSIMSFSNNMTVHIAQFTISIEQWQETLTLAYNYMFQQLPPVLNQAMNVIEMTGFAADDVYMSANMTHVQSTITEVIINTVNTPDFFGFCMDMIHPVVTLGFALAIHHYTSSIYVLVFLLSIGMVQGAGFDALEQHQSEDYFSMTLCLVVCVCFAKRYFVKKNKLGQIEQIKREYETLDSSCIGELKKIKLDTYNVKWSIKDAVGKPVEPNSDYGHCDCLTQEIRRKDLTKTNNFEDDEKAIIYHSCYKNNLSSILRMVDNVPKPEKEELIMFKKFVDQELYKSGGIYDTITYNYNCDVIQWFNHLSAAKQAEVRPHFDYDGNTMFENEVTFNDIVKINEYNNFVKSEKQFGVDAKTRCICSPGSEYKFVMGPVCLELERVFKEYFGYGCPPNWEELESFYNDCDDRGLNKTFQLDGSGFDITQHMEIKQIIDHQIYGFLYNNGLIDHVDPKVFLAAATAEWRKISLKNTIGGSQGKIVSYGSVKVRGKVFSGSCDTTLMNTLRMALYNRYICEVKLQLRPHLDYELLVKGDDVVVLMGNTKLTDNDFALVKKAYRTVFVDKVDASDVTHYGLGQIAKYYKTGGIEQIDFCSTNTIQTDVGFKVIRKLKNITDKEHYSLKIKQAHNYNDYHKELLTASKKWIGGCPTLEDYFVTVHHHGKVSKPKNLQGKQKLALPFEKECNDYTSITVEYEKEVVHAGRTTSTPLSDLDLFRFVYTSNDPEAIRAYELMNFRIQTFDK
jgi:hypothetical protein